MCGMLYRAAVIVVYTSLVHKASPPSCLNVICTLLHICMSTATYRSCIRDSKYVHVKHAKNRNAHFSLPKMIKLETRGACVKVTGEYSSIIPMHSSHYTWRDGATEIPRNAN